MKPVNVISVLLGAFVLASLGCQKGEQGPAGASGGGRIVSTMNCAGVISGSIIAALNGLSIEYNAVLTSGGDVYATANIVDNAIQISGTAFYAAGESGANTASVLITDDYYGSVNGGYWSISLNRSTMQTSIVYNDTVSDSFTFTSSACTVANL